MGCCKVLVSWSSSLLDLSKPHITSPTAIFIYLFISVCTTIRLLYQKILRALLQLFSLCFPLLVNVSAINLSIPALFKSTRFLSYDLVLSWGPERPVQMRGPLQPALCKHNPEPSLKNLAALVSELVGLNHLGMYLRGAHYRWACYGENNTVVIVSSTLLGRQICCWSAVVFWLLLSITEIFLSQMWFLLALNFVSWFALPSIQQSLWSCFGGGKELERPKIYFSVRISVREGAL